MSINLNPAQLDAVTAQENILCCACPGSGKTRVLIAKVVALLQRRPEAQVILTTFSRDAANELLERLRQALPTRAMRSVTVGTFHALAMRQLKGANITDHILSAIEVNHVILRAIEDLGMKLSLDEAEMAIAACKIDPDYAKAFPAFASLTRIYQRELDARNACDFIDLIVRANDMMSAGNLAPLAATHVFCDEFQDIDRIQYEWLRHHIADDREVCVVGDDDQCIYGFRRSLGYEGMMNFVAMTGARIITLDANYRSTRQILECAGRVIGHNLDRVKKRMTAERGDGWEPELVNVVAQGVQADHIIETLSVLCRNNPVPQTVGDKPYRFGVKHGQAAVLARTNRQLLAIERQFIENRVPYLRAGRSLWDDQILPQVFVSLLQSLHARSSVGIEVALRWAQIPDSLLRPLAESVGGNLWALLDPQRPQLPVVPGGPVVESLIVQGRGWVRKLEEGGESAVKGVIYGVAAWMANVLKDSFDMDEEGPARERRPRDLKNLWIIDVVKDSLDGFSGTLQQRIALARQDGSEKIPRVILSTFHSAKGLEWNNVFLIDLVTGSVPKVGPEASETTIAEERRVFYVAMTRARDRLYMYTYPKKNGGPSEFLIEAGMPVSQAEEPEDTCYV